MMPSLTKKAFLYIAAVHMQDVSAVHAQADSIPFPGYQPIFSSRTSFMIKQAKMFFEISNLGHFVFNCEIFKVKLLK